MPTKTAPIVTLFTHAEHAILVNWLMVEPATEASGVDPDPALLELGFTREPGAIYSIEDAAVAHILLARVEARLPCWAAIRISACGVRVHQHRAILHAEPWSNGECRLMA